VAVHPRPRDDGDISIGDARAVEPVEKVRAHATLRTKRCGQGIGDEHRHLLSALDDPLFELWAADGRAQGFVEQLDSVA
jgi:hypothetical protein